MRWVFISLKKTLSGKAGDDGDVGLLFFTGFTGRLLREADGFCPTLV